MSGAAVRWLQAIFIPFFLLVTATVLQGASPDAPHDDFAPTSVGCLSCHDMSAYDQANLIPDTGHVPQDIDDTLYNNLCWSCHNSIDAPYVKTHSSLQTSSRYGDWTVECWVCHNQHSQAQLKTYGPASWLYTGVSTGLTANTLTLTGAGWTSDQFKNMVLVPNTSDLSGKYFILSNTSDTLTVRGTIDLGRASVGDTFGIIVGKLIRDRVRLDNITDPLVPKSGNPQVRFFGETGANSFADGDGTYDGICEVCHTETTHFRNDGSGSDQLHTNMGAVAGTDCMSCHDHSNGFAHGGGSGTGCWECHGHDTGYNDPVYGVVTGGRGTFQSHSTHTENDADDLKGPNLACGDCHDTANFPNFKDGQTTLAATTVCDTCHSAGGTYDGLDDPVVGAKTNWRDSIYDHAGGDPFTLRTGKEKWCATCHDEAPSVIAGVTAPNVIGDEDGAYTYGTGWGYFKTGHGLAAGEAYPSKGGLIEPPLTGGASRPVYCDGCHDFSTSHIDGLARTYDDGESSTLDASAYRQGYRLKQVAAGTGAGASGKEPLQIPFQVNTGNNANNYRLCATCHDPAAFLDNNDLTMTNLVTTDLSGTLNRHATHLNMNSAYWASDWSGGNTSRITCVSCHNVHGSRRLAMVRDGKLTGRETPGSEEGLLIWYKNDAVSIYNTSNPDPPTPEDIPLAASDGTIWVGNSSVHLCTHCHGSPNTLAEDRAPFQNVAQAPALSWTGEPGFVSDGALPDSGPSGNTFEFRVEYTDTNNDAPTSIQVWVDEDDSGTYEPGEKYDMAVVDPGDTSYIDGRLYSKNLALGLAGDNVLNYRFYASDGTADATGPPTASGSVEILPASSNNAPILAWVTGACRSEGVSPRAEVSGTSFDFRVNYTDADNECPTTIEVWIDEDLSGTYSAGEKHALTETDGGDLVCSDGKEYSFARVLTAAAGDRLMAYRFVASDGTDAATGEPAVDHEVTVIDTGAMPLRTVCPGGHPDGPCDDATIQSGIDALGGAHTVLVSSGTYNENIALDGTNDNNTVVRSKCGRENTTINGSATVVDFQFNNTGSVVDGFEITGGTRGVYLNTASATVRNSSIHGNNAGASAGGGVYTTGASSFTLEDCEVYSNTGTNGAGIFFNGGTHTINQSVIRNNIGTGSGSGINFQWTGAGTSITDSVIRDNTATGAGGGLYFNGGQATFARTQVTGNSSSSSGGGVYMTNGASSATFENCVLAGNSGTQGGFIFVNAGTTSYVNSTLADNQATAGNGGAIFLNCATTTMRNSIFWNNTASGSGNNLQKACGGGNAGAVSDSNFTSAAGFFDGGTLTLTNNIDPQQDPKFVGGGDYHIQSGSPVIDQASATYAPADDIDGDTRPQGLGDDMGADELATPAGGNTAPTLAWTGEAGYTTDGVDPDSGAGGTSFTFRATYTDADDDAPAIIQVWVDEDNNGVYAAAEKYGMTVSGGDGDYTNGEIYTKSLVLAPVSGGQVRYRFHAGDGADEATGPPTADKTVAVNNNVPTLSWTGEAGYTTDGVAPDSGAGGTSFTFRVTYTDADNTAPATIQVWVDEDDSGIVDPGEKYDLTVSGGDGDYTNGEVFTKTLTLAYLGDGTLGYSFHASDGSSSATGAPVTGGNVVVTAPAGNIAPVLSWSTANCLTDGVRPRTGAEDADFDFLVTYTDADNQCADIIQVWVDENDNGSIESGEKHDLAPLVPGDTDCTDGKTYGTSVPLGLAGDGTLNYRFFATDGVEPATGAPASNQPVTVVTAFKVRPTGGLGWYATIQGAVDASTDSSLILVYPNADYTAATYNEDVTIQSKNNRTLRSVCGADLTAISGSFAALLIQSSNIEVDGLTFTGSPTGVYVNLGDPVTVKNSRMHTNDYGMYLNNGAQVTVLNNEIYSNAIRGIHTNPGTTSATITGCDIHDNGSTYAGSGIYFNFGVHTVTDTLIRNNAGTGDGGGIYFNGVGAGTTLTGVTVSGNTTNSRGGGLHIANGSLLTIDKSTITGNRATGNIGGGMYVSDGSSIVTVTNTVLAANQADKGGGAYLHSGTITFVNDTIADNQATAGSGGAFAACNLVNNTVRNSIFWNNTATVSGNNAFKECGAALFMSVYDSDITTGPGFIDGGTITASSTIDPAQDPQFVGGGDYHLTCPSPPAVCSPCVDAGAATGAPADDIDNDARPNDIAGMGDGVDDYDMGADEFTP
ncbi:MAG: hypothetical protein Kow0089_23200 [Desulfobulbaceae bacterium]